MGTKIIMAVCFLPCLLIMFGFLYMEGRQKGNILMGVTLWPGAEKEDAVIAIQKRFKREMLTLFLISIFLYVLGCMPNRESVFLCIQFVWLIFVIIIFFFPLAWGNNRLKTLKREWKVVQQKDTEDYKRYIDITAAAQPKKKPFIKLSIVGALLAFVPVLAELFLVKNRFYGWWTELFLVTMFLVGVLCFGIQYFFWQLRTDVVSMQSEVNIQLARVRQYQWSRCFCIVIWCNTIFTTIMWWGMHKPKVTFWVIFISSILYTLLVTVVAFVTVKNVRNAYDKYATDSLHQIDEDEYWIWGIFYCNKNDKRFMVNRRVGVGTTVNMAKTSGKIFTIGVSVWVVLLLLWGTAVVLLEDFVPISLKLEQESVVASQYKEEYSILEDEIESVELVEELPRMSKRAGTAMDNILKGSFLDAEYNSCKVCVRKQKPPFLKLVTKDGMTYYLNDEEADVTMEVFQQLTIED